MPHPKSILIDDDNGNSDWNVMIELDNSLNKDAGQVIMLEQIAEKVPSALQISTLLNTVTLDLLYLLCPPKVNMPKTGICRGFLSYNYSLKPFTRAPFENQTV